MGLLEKAGNVQTEEKKATKVVKAEKEAEKFNQAVAKAAKKVETSPKETKKAAKVKKAKKPKKVKTPRTKKERILKEFPEGFDEVNKARSWFRTLVDLVVNFSLFSFYLLTNIVAGGAGLPMSNILFRNTFTPKSFGTSRGLSQPFIFLFQAIGTPGVALIFQYYGNYDNAFLMLTIMVVLAIFIIWLMKKPQEVLASNS